MVYIADDGEIICDYLEPKKLLDSIRFLCKGKSEPIMSLCRRFNDETDDGRKMDTVSLLLNDAIGSIIQTKDECDIDSLFSPGGTTLLSDSFKGLDDFELVCFLVVKGEEK